MCQPVKQTPDASMHHAGVIQVYASITTNKLFQADLHSPVAQYAQRKRQVKNAGQQRGPSAGRSAVGTRRGFSLVATLKV